MANRTPMQKELAKNSRKNFLINNRGLCREYTVWHRLMKIKRIPKWADRDEIKKVYEECGKRRSSGEKVTVDHIVPLQGKVVSGLHVHENLRIIPGKDNDLKYNKWPL